MLLHGHLHRCSRLGLCLMQLRFHLSAQRSIRIRHRLRHFALALCARSVWLLANRCSRAACRGSVARVLARAICFACTELLPRGSYEAARPSDEQACAMCHSPAAALIPLHLHWLESRPSVRIDRDREVGTRYYPVTVLAAAKDDAVGRLVEGQPTFDRLVHVDPYEDLGVAAHPADHALLAEQPLGEVHVVPAHARESLLEDRLYVLHVRSVDRHLRRCLERERLALLLADARHVVPLRCANLRVVV
mmetsp:Transcript_6137/g.14347  ORF Transcript_6137/g.14347 Transcript_6137/m.14347 type:complete len:248 (+) Transcript_6137:3951-4694(+)